MKFARPMTVSPPGSSLTRPAATATYFDYLGVMRTAPVNLPRWDYDPADLTRPPRLLIEPTVTNQLSAPIDWSGWSKGSNMTVTPNVAGAPDGTATMNTLTLDGLGGNTWCLLTSGAAYTPNQVACGSAYVMAGTKSKVHIQVGKSDSTSCAVAEFDLSTGQMTSAFGFGTGVLVGYGIQPIGASGLYRIWVSGYWNGAQMTLLCNHVDATAGTILAGFGFLEYGVSSPSSFTLTTRNADVLPSWLTTVQEAVPATYAGGTTYALADVAAVSLGANGYDVYRSLQPSNTGHTPASSPTWWQRINTVYGVWSAVTAYTIADIVTGVGATAHMLFKSVTGGTNKALPASATSNSDWTYIGATMPWKTSDLVVQDQCQATTHIGFMIQGVGRVDTVGALNISAARMRVMVYDPTDGYVFDSTVNLTQTSGINTWWAYFTEPIKRAPDACVDGMPPYLNAYIIISLLDAGNVVSVGELVLGQELQVGDTQYGAQVTIQDYSVKQQDAFGNWTIVKRSYSKQGQFEVWCDAGDSDQIVYVLAQYRSTPILYWGSDTYSSTLIYGFYKDFTFGFTYFEKSVMQINIEGLT